MATCRGGCSALLERAEEHLRNIHPFAWVTLLSPLKSVILYPDNNLICSPWVRRGRGGQRDRGRDIQRETGGEPRPAARGVCVLFRPRVPSPRACRLELSPGHGAITEYPSTCVGLNAMPTPGLLRPRGVGVRRRNGLHRSQGSPARVRDTIRIFFGVVLFAPPSFRLCPKSSPSGLVTCTIIAVTVTDGTALLFTASSAA